MVYIVYMVYMVYIVYMVYMVYVVCVVCAACVVYLAVYINGSCTHADWDPASLLPHSVGEPTPRI